MSSNYRVILGYLKKVAEDAITPEKKRELLEHIKQNPYMAYRYLDNGWLKPEEPEVKQAILEDIKKVPHYSYKYYIDKGRLKPEEPEVKQAILEAKQAILEHIKKDPRDALVYIDNGWLKPEDEEVKQVLLEHIKKDPDWVPFWVEEALKPEDEGVKQVLLEHIKEDPYDAHQYINEGWLKPEDEGVKKVLLGHIKKNPDCAYVYIDNGWLKPEEPEVKQATLEAKQAILEHIKKDPSWAHRYIDNGWLKPEDEEVKQVFLGHIKKDPSLAQNYIDYGWLKPEDEGFKQALLEGLKKDPSYTSGYLNKGWLKPEDVNNFMSETFKTPVEDFSHSHSSNLVILQKLRSSAKNNGGKVGVIPQFKSLFSGKEFLTVADIDKLIDKDSKHNKSNAYEFDHRMWGEKSGQNSFGETQLVIQVKSLPASIQSEINSTDYLKEFMNKILAISKSSRHPHAYGWARVHVKDKDTWVIDEIQSDVIKAYNDLASNVQYAARFNAPLIMNNLPAIGAFVKKHFKDIRDVIISAVRERAHKAGVNNIEHMNVEFKVKQNLKVRRDAYGDHEKEHHVKVLNSEGKIVSKTKGEVELGEDTPIPAHYTDTYLKSLEKDGFERDEKTQRFKIHSSLDWFLASHD